MSRIKRRVVFDVGATWTRVAAASGRRVVDAMRFPTPPSYRAGVEALRQAAIALVGGTPTIAAGGLPGPFSRRRDRTMAPNLPDWAGRPVLRDLARAFGCRVVIENDAALGGLGEAVFGAGRSTRLVAYLALGTGLGGAMIVDGRVAPNALGFEPGFQIVDLHTRAALSAIVGGRSLAGSSTRALTERRMRDTISRIVAVGIHNAIVHWSPEVVVLGGGVMKQLSMTAIREELAATLAMLPVRPRLRRARLGQVAGLYGALALLEPRRRATGDGVDRTRR